MPNFCARIADAAARFAERPAIEMVRAAGSVEVTAYRALLDDARQFAAWLGAAGVVPGARAAILADNDARWIAAYLGTLWMGGVAVPLDTAYKPAQVRAILESSGPHVLFTTPKYLETAQAAVQSMGAGAPRVVLLSGGEPGLAGPPEIASAGSAPPIADAAPDAAAVILYTSGTTADPKGVVLTHGNLDAERLAVLAIVNATERDAVLGVLPLFHALAQMANLLLPLSVGARVVFLETVNSSTLLAALESRGITIFACVPQFFYLIHQRLTAEFAKSGVVSRTLIRTIIGANVRLRDRFGWNPGRHVFARVHRALGPAMRVLVTGGSRFDPAIGRDLYGCGFTLQNAYGLTETSGGATMQRPGDRFTTSVGQPFIGVEIRIAASADLNSPTSNFEVGTSKFPEGEILIRGPIIMREYFNRPDATAEALQDGWLHTGDLGRLDAQGRLYITGRLKEIIVLASGKNLYPEEIEAHYQQSQFIKELCVLGLSRPGEPSAERLHAVVVPDERVLRERGIANLGEWLRFEIESLSVQLPAHKRILGYDITLEPLPRTTTGKLKRPEIERRALERAAAATRADDRPLSEAEKSWLETPAHAAIVTAIGTRLGRPTVRPDANLELDLGLDSMERVELLTMLEQRVATRVPAAVRATIFTVRQLVDAVVTGEPARDDAAATGPADDAWDVLLQSEPEPRVVQALAKPKNVRFFFYMCLLRTVGFVARGLLKFRASGTEHLPRSGAFIISPNHQAFIDPLFLAAVLPYDAVRRMFSVGAAENFATPFGTWFAQMANIVPVDSDSNLVSAMRAGATGLRLNKVLVLFPEGERSIDGDLKKFKKGAAILSAQLDAPIVPVALDGLYDLWPRGRPLNWAGFLPWRSAPVTLRFGPPLQVKRGAYAEGTAELRREVERMLGEIREGQRAEGKGQR